MRAKWRRNTLYIYIIPDEHYFNFALAVFDRERTEHLVVWDKPILMLKWSKKGCDFSDLSSDVPAYLLMGSRDITNR